MAYTFQVSTQTFFKGRFNQYKTTLISIQSIIGIAILALFSNGSFAQTYCPVGIQTDVEPITLVQFADINDVNSNSITTIGSLLTSSPAYEDFTSIIGHVSPGCTYTMTVEGNTNGTGKSYFRAFIDWNNNGTLDDAGELFDLGFIQNSTGIDGKQLQLDITIPATMTGNVRMRVFKRQDIGTIPQDPCLDVNRGQIVDYTLALNTGGPAIISSAVACGGVKKNIGPGTYQDIILEANTYYNFSYSNGGSSGFEAQVISGGVGATSAIFNTTTNNWFSGTTAPTVRFIAQGCVGSSPVAVLTYRHSAPNRTTVSGTGVFCEDAMPKTITATEGEFGTIYWQNTTSSGTSTASASISESVVNEGTYYFRSNNNGCWGIQGKAVIQVDKKPTLPTSITVDNNVNNCHGREITLTAVGGVLEGTSQYKWGTTLGYSQIEPGTTSTTITHTPLSTTSYYVSVTSNGKCASQSLATPLVYTLPAKAASLSSNESATCYVSGSNPIHFYSTTTNKYVGSINPNGRTGTLTMTSYTGAGGIMSACSAPDSVQFKTAFMSRNFTVIPTGVISGTGSLSVYFPFTGSELTDLQISSTTGTPGNLKDDVTAITDLVMTQHSGPTEDGDPFNNCLDGSSVVVALTASGALNTALTLSPVITANYGRVDISSFSEFYFHGVNNNSPLPVNLTSFTANCDNQTILNWTTASEQNSDNFIVEKSRDGQNWVFVSKNTAAGNSNMKVMYRAIDESPLNGVNYYRLRQVDLNGVEQIYGPISTSCSSIQNNSMTVYPNPNNGAFTVEISTTEYHTGAQLVLTDMTGRTVVSQVVNITAGTNQIMISNGNLQMGTYMVTVHGIDSELKPVKVVVNR